MYEAQHRELQENAALLLQRRWRHWQVTMQEQAHRAIQLHIAEREASARAVQAAWRGHVARHAFIESMEMDTSAELIQAAWRLRQQRLLLIRGESMHMLLPTGFRSVSDLSRFVVSNPRTGVCAGRKRAWGSCRACTRGHSTGRCLSASHRHGRLSPCQHARAGPCQASLGTNSRASHCVHCR